MELTTITNFISQVGFPIAVCAVCFWYINKREEEHREEVKKMTEAINNNTLALQNLIAKMNDNK